MTRTRRVRSAIITVVLAIVLAAAAVVVADVVYAHGGSTPAPAPAPSAYIDTTPSPPQSPCELMVEGQGVTDPLQAAQYCEVLGGVGQ